MIEKIKELIKKLDWKYWWVIIYFPVYMTAFMIAEKFTAENHHIISISIDKKIPFIEWFCIPYYVWFPFVALFFVWFFFLDKKEFSRMIQFLYVGMTLFIVISFVYPNGLDLRPEIMPRDNIATKVVSMLYATDTPTNVFPSIHVYNTLGVLTAIWHSKVVLRKTSGKIMISLLGILIIVSTVFLKQHSLVDVIGAFAIGAVIYLVVYRKDFCKMKSSVATELN